LIISLSRIAGEGRLGAQRLVGEGIAGGIALTRLRAPISATLSRNAGEGL